MHTSGKIYNWLNRDRRAKLDELKTTVVSKQDINMWNVGYDDAIVQYSKFADQYGDYRENGGGYTFKQWLNNGGFIK